MEACATLPISDSPTGKEARSEVQLPLGIALAAERSFSPVVSLPLFVTATESAEEPVVEKVRDDYFDDFVEDLDDPDCVQKIYDFALREVRGSVEYSDEEDVIQEVFWRLTRWPIGKKYNSANHYFSLLKITVRQAVIAYWKRRHSQRNDARRRVFISQLEKDTVGNYEFAAEADNVLACLQVKELVKQILARVEELSSDSKTMFEMRFLQEKSHEEIAEVLQVSLRTSYRLETKVRELLREHFRGNE